MKMVFLDTEFTGLHAFTTLISVGLVTLDGQELYVMLNDYDKDQITPRVKLSVLKKVDEAFNIIKNINKHNKRNAQK